MSDPHVPLRIANRNVFSKVFDDEAVVLDSVNGVYFSLRGTGVDIWRLIEDNATGAQISEALSARYDAPQEDIARAAGDLLEELTRAELIVPDPSLEANGASLAATEKRPFAAPEIERFTDMQQLLLLDPIHEVEDGGWPHTPPTS